MPSPQVRHSLAKMCNNLLGFYALFLLCPPAPFHEHENVAAHAHACVCGRWVGWHWLLCHKTIIACPSLPTSRQCAFPAKEGKSEKHRAMHSSGVDPSQQGTNPRLGKIKLWDFVQHFSNIWRASKESKDHGSWSSWQKKSVFHHQAFVTAYLLDNQSVEPQLDARYLIPSDKVT